MWEVTLWKNRMLEARRFDDADEIGMTALWAVARHLPQSTCRRVDLEGHALGTRRPCELPPHPRAYRILCQDCGKEAWSYDPNDLLCVGCAAAIYPNDPTPHGRDCVIADNGYHSWAAADPDGIRRCRHCSKRETGR